MWVPPGRCEVQLEACGGKKSDSSTPGTLVLRRWNGKSAFSLHTVQTRAEICSASFLSQPLGPDHCQGSGHVCKLNRLVLFKLACGLGSRYAATLRPTRNTHVWLSMLCTQLPPTSPASLCTKDPELHPDSLLAVQISIPLFHHGLSHM